MMTISIADVSIEMCLPAFSTLSKEFLPFEVKTKDSMITAHWSETTSLPEPKGELVFRGNSYDVYRAGQEEIRYFHEHQEPEKVYARLCQTQGNVVIEYLMGSECHFTETQNCFWHLALEDRLIRYDGFLLHASLISTQHGGILFSGPSGIGKSTQADLWERYRDAVQINGDRPVVRRVGGAWYAYGSPYAGSSRIYRNERAPVRVIVLLEQGKAREIRRITGGEAFRRLYQGVKVNNWNPRFAECICSLLADLITKTEILVYRCTPDERAVEALERYLQELPEERRETLREKPKEKLAQTEQGRSSGWT